MKKIISLLLVLATIFGISACGKPKTIGEAVKKANSLVEKWDRKSKHMSGYSSEYNEKAQMYFVTTYSLTADDETEFAKDYNARRNSEFVYEELKDLFEEFDVKIVVMMNDENQNVYYVTVDNKPIDLGLLK